MVDMRYVLIIITRHAFPFTNVQVSMHITFLPVHVLCVCCVMFLGWKQSLCLLRWSCLESEMQ